MFPSWDAFEAITPAFKSDSIFNPFFNGKQHFSDTLKTSYNLKYMHINLSYTTVTFIVKINTHAFLIHFHMLLSTKLCTQYAAYFIWILHGCNDFYTIIMYYVLQHFTESSFSLLYIESYTIFIFNLHWKCIKVNFKRKNTYKTTWNH